MVFFLVGDTYFVRFFNLLYLFAFNFLWYFQGLLLNASFISTTDWQKASDTIKESLCTAPVWRFSDYEEKFMLITDASNHKLLRTLNKAAVNYNTTKKELLVIVCAWKILKQHLLRGKFTIQTDYQALIWLHNFEDPSSQLLRWRLRLEKYQYNAEYV